ncbi:hypothetical protein BDZ97DRAFT_2059781 [Flammula alnicola]|nr:hypothetical protein BDZ97DRAFT_2059781 [Flammula alnicola]
MRVSFVVLSVLGVIASASATALESRDSYYYPQCCYDCMNSYSYWDYGCSSSDDYECLCSNSDWKDSMHSCFKRNCYRDDYRRGKKSIHHYCRKAMVGKSLFANARGITPEIDAPIYKLFYK